MRTGGESAMPISPAVHSQAVRRGEMGESSSPDASGISVVAMLKLKGT